MRARFSGAFQSCAYAFLRTTPSAPITKFSGTPVVWYTFWIVPSGSCSTSKVTPKPRMNCWTLGASPLPSSTLTATTLKPRGAKSR